jgi:xylulokinase
MAALIIAADFGTTGVKIGAVDHDLRLVAWVRESYPLAVDAASAAAEQNPQDWWDAAGRGIARLSAQLPGLREAAGALVLCAQMCGVVCVDASGAPLRPCLIWLDKRAGAAARRLVGGIPSYEGYALAKLARWLPLANGAPSLNGADPPAKLQWLRENEPEVWQSTDKLLDVRDWLVLRATARAVTTCDCANLTWMMDSRAGRIGWSPSLMRLVGVDRARLPDIVDGSAIVGGLRADAARELGLREGLPVVAGSGDVCASALGSGAVADGALHIHVGTSSWVGGFFPSRRLSVAKHYATIASAAGARPLLIATQETAGECLNWAARAFGAPKSGNDGVASLISAAEACAPSPQGPLFLPWLAGERMPVDDERLRGGFLGLSLAHERPHLARAVLEGIALNLRWALEYVGRERGAKGGAMPVVGTVAGARFFVQLLADVLQRPLQMLADPACAGVLGASTFAAAALKWSASPWEAAQRCARNAALIMPDGARAEFYAGRLAQLKHAWRRTAPWFRKAMA